MLELHAERVGIAAHRVLGGRVHALQRDRAIGHNAADVDDRATRALQMATAVRQPLTTPQKFVSNSRFLSSIGTSVSLP